MINYDVAYPAMPTPALFEKRWLYWLLKRHFVYQFRGEYRRAVLSMLERNDEAKLLDLGCGNGEFTTVMAKTIGTPNAYGVDRLDGGSVGFKRVEGDLNRPLPFEDEAFDVVVGAQIIEHLNDTDTFIKEAYRVLKYSGYFIVSTDNLASLHNVIYLALGKQPEACAVSDEMGKRYKRAGHRRLFTIQALTQLLRYYGFGIEKVMGSCYTPLPLPLARFMCLIDKRHSKGITMKARKSGSKR